jgi:TonB family protein
MKNDTRHGRFTTGFLLLALLPHAVLSQDDGTAEAPAVSTYTMPQVLERPRVRYPTNLANTGQEGVVQLNLMVDTEGRVFEPTVIHATGAEGFQRAALQALEDMTFKPAMLDGAPTVSSFPLIIQFTLETPALGAGAAFVRTYREYQRVLQESGQDEARSALDALVEAGARNHYENAFLNLGQYLYHQKYGSALEQMEWLGAALTFADSEDDVTYLPEEMKLPLFRQMFSLQVRNSRVKEAIKTFELLDAMEDSEGTTVLRPVYDTLLALENDDTSYSVEGVIDDAGSWSILLHKHHVYVDQIQGKLAEFKLRCSSHYVGFAVEPLFSYEVPEAWGDCSLQVIGDPGTTFLLVQL